MKKVVSSILMTVVLLANLFAPVSVGWGDKKIEIEENRVEASSIKLEMNISKNDTSIFVETLAYWYDGEKPTSIEKVFVNIEGTKNGEDYKDAEKVDLYEVSTREEGVYSESGNIEFTNLDPNTTYKITAVAMQSELDPLSIKRLLTTGGLAYFIGTRFDKVTSTVTGNTIEVKTLPGGNTSFETDERTYVNKSEESYMPACGVKVAGVGVGSLAGCLAQGIYYLIFMPSSVLFALAGTFFDNTFAYSVNDASYRSSFVVQGWNVVRDFCNMFFIFVLLYIAFKTILDLNGAKTKEMIVNVVIIGLLINFSLFATRVIIDASNILARVFYNSNTIQITALDEDGGGNEVTDTIAKMNKTGVLPLSAALVNKVNPQSLIINAKEYGEIPDKAGQSDSSENQGGVTTRTFIFITLLASGINIVGFIVFLSVGLIFVLRVVMLWLAMILAPFAFFSYTVPAMQDIPTVGLKKWWPETLSMAFLAPVFIFFLYLILQFLEVGLGIADMSGKEGMLNKIVAIVIPFAFIMVLLMKAKSVAVKMSGEMGAAVAKAGSAVGGLALGAGVGFGAMAMRGTIGRAGSAIANSDRVKGWEKKGIPGAALLRNIGKSAGSGSMDIRGTKLGASAGKGLGVESSIGKAKEGGFEKIKAEKIDKRVKRAKELEMGEGSKDKRESSKLEASLRAAKSEQASSLSKWEREITKQRQELTDAKNAKDKTAMAKAKTELDNAKKELDKIKIAPTSHGGSINYLEAELNRVNDAINAAEIKSMNEYAANIESMGNKTLNYFKSFGQHSGVGANIAADRIRKGVKIENTTK